MAQHDYDLANQSGSSFRTDLNNCLDAIQSTNSGSSAPSSTVAFQLWADSNTGILKIRNAANDDWVGLFQLDGTLTLEDGSASTPGLAFRDDLNTGIWSSGADAVDIATGGTNRLTVNSTGLTMSACNIVLGDSGGTGDDRIVLGAGSDLSLFHDGSHSYIKDGGTGNLYIQGSHLYITDEDGTNMIFVGDNGGVYLYYNGALKFETNTNGCLLGDDVKLQIGSSSDLQLYHSSSESRITNSTGSLWLQSDTGIRFTDLGVNESFAAFYDNGACEIYYDGSKKFETTSYGVEVKGYIQADGSSGYGFTGGDNVKLSLGGGNDLQLWHDGSNSYVKDNGTGALIYVSDTHSFRNAADSEQLAKFNEDGNVQLYYDDVLQMRTHANGIFTRGIYPITDNSFPMGSGSERYTTIYATTSTINTSDRTEKNTIVNSDLGLDFINKLNPISYKWNKDDGKTHYGLIAQDVEETLTSIGKTISDFGGIHKEDNSLMGLRYTELISPLIKAVQELSAKVAVLEAED
jgi:hypothetical protein